MNSGYIVQLYVSYFHWLNRGFMYVLFFGYHNFSKTFIPLEMILQPTLVFFKLS